MLAKIRNFRSFIHLSVVIFNPWWWIIIQRNVWVGLLVVILSFLVFKYFWQIEQKNLLVPVIVLTVAIAFVIFREAFDESIFRKSALDIQQYNKRHEFYAKGLGKIYTNRFSLIYFKDVYLPLYKLQRNFFANLDPNLYFFKSHPRERLGVEEFSKYLPFFLPFFLLGFLYALCRPLPKILLYLVIVSLVSSIISPNYNLGPLLFFSIVNFMTSVGLILTSDYFIKVIRREIG